MSPVGPGSYLPISALREPKIRFHGAIGKERLWRWRCHDLVRLSNDTWNYCDPRKEIPIADAQTHSDMQLSYTLGNSIKSNYLNGKRNECCESTLLSLVSTINSQIIPPELHKKTAPHHFQLKWETFGIKPPQTTSYLTKKQKHERNLGEKANVARLLLTQPLPILP